LYTDFHQSGFLQLFAKSHHILGYSITWRRFRICTFRWQSFSIIVDTTKHTRYLGWHVCEMCIL